MITNFGVQEQDTAFLTKSINGLNYCANQQKLTKEACPYCRNKQNELKK